MTARSKDCIMNGKNDKQFLSLVRGKILKKRLLANDEKELFDSVVGDPLVYQNYVAQIEREVETPKI